MFQGTIDLSDIDRSQLFGAEDSSSFQEKV